MFMGYYALMVKLFEYLEYMWNNLVPAFAS